MWNHLIVKDLPDTIIYKIYSELLEFKIKNAHNYSAVIVSEDNALDFVLSKQHTLFNDIPIVFLGINDVKKAVAQNLNPLVTGIVEEVSIQETLNLILKLFPNSKKIYTISDGTKSGKIDLQHFKRIILQQSNSEYIDISLNNYSLNEIGNVLQKIESNSPVLLISALKDKEGESMDFYCSLNLIKKNLNAPLFHLFQHGMGERNYWRQVSVSL